MVRYFEFQLRSHFVRSVKGLSEIYITIFQQGFMYDLMGVLKSLRSFRIYEHSKNFIVPNTISADFSVPFSSQAEKRNSFPYQIRSFTMLRSINFQSKRSFPHFCLQLSIRSLGFYKHFKLMNSVHTVYSSKLECQPEIHECFKK